MICRDWVEADGGAACVDGVGVTQPCRHEPALAYVKLGAIELRLAARQQHPVRQMSEIDRRCLAALDGLRQQRQAASLQGRVEIGVLR